MAPFAEGQTVIDARSWLGELGL